MKGVTEEAKILEQNENIDIMNLWEQETNIDNVWNEDENANIIDLWTPCEIHIDENYEYMPKENTFFSICSDLLYYGIAYPILKILTKMIYDLKIEGQENIENIAGGAISVSNHVLFLDCAMIGLAFKDKNIYYTTQEESFKIPFVRKLIKLLRAIPIPKSIENKKHFLKAIDDAFKNIIQVNIKGKTIAHDIEHKYNASKILLKPASEGTGVIAGGSARPVIELAGIKDILTKSLGSNNPYNVVRATIDALAKIKA